ncbi:MAG TPA: type II toxin-antitoxin system HicB family antitoxin [Pyrinomonadaceae bacterium]|jgi:predicted RNase H-like HicB family nuclease|nr:type II toxin-antitoxin system HicB family antitoxin [Pyrinomonadaceae bacterium]
MKNGSLPKYEIVVYWDDEDDLYVAVVPDLPGCMAHGKTHVEAVENVGEAIALWIDTAREFGDEIPQPTHHALDLIAA